MVLEERSLSAYNAMVGRTSKVTGRLAKHGTHPFERPAKKQKISNLAESASENESSDLETRVAPSQSSRKVVPDSDAESNDEILGSQRTDIEQALPPIKTDRDAIQEYEAFRAAEGAQAKELEERLGKRHWVKGRSSIYVDAFNLALETVLEDESHLFDEAEMQVFNDWRGLSYEAQYLYVRLFLRKTSAWHRINKLGYYGDIADLDAAADSLFSIRQLPQRPRETQTSPGELEPPEGTTLDESYTFADNSDNHISTLEEASSLLLLDELKVIAKEAKVQGKNKTDLLKALRHTSGRQTALGFASLQRTDTEESIHSIHSEGRGDSPSPRTNRDEHYVHKIMAETGRCIRISLAPFKLFERVHLVFYRSTEWTEKSLTTIILARIARRNFPEYVVSRSANIFPSRSLLLEFEASVRTQFRIDGVLEMNGVPTLQGLQSILDIFEDVYPRWQVLLKEEQHKEDSIYFTGEGAYLRRLSPAWVYTRIIHKGAYVLGLGKFKQHFKEHSVLSDLVKQRLFHAARRGAWYQRKALLEEHYMADLTPVDGRSMETRKKHWKRVALQTCEEGLQDNMVHVIYHYDLQKRITKLEKSLKTPKRLQHEFVYARLTKPTERTFEGIRVERPSGLLKRKSSAGESSPATSARRGGKTIWIDPSPLEPPDTRCSVEAMCLSHYRALGWKGYHTEGGILRTLFAYLFYDVLFAYVPNVFQTPYQTCPLDLHTDGGFYSARFSECNARLADLENGRAAVIVKDVWGAHHERRTCVVGLDWTFELDDLLEICDAFDGGALAVVCKVMCQEYAQRGGGVPDLFLWKLDKIVKREEEEAAVDAKSGTSIVDRASTKRTGTVCFAEVKSENDRLSDTQRLWIHVLAGAGIAVELCNAVASEVRMLD